MRANGSLSPQITKEELDDYDGGPAVPAFQLQLKMAPSFSPKALEQRVGFVGITPKNSFITITKEPMFEGMYLSSYKSLNKQSDFFPALTSHRKEIVETSHSRSSSSTYTDIPAGSDTTPHCALTTRMLTMRTTNI